MRAVAVTIVILSLACGDGSPASKMGEGGTNSDGAMSDVSSAIDSGTKGSLCCIGTAGNSLNVHCGVGTITVCLLSNYVPPDAGLPSGYTSYNAAECAEIGDNCTAWPNSYGPCQTGCCMGTVDYCE